MYRLEEDVIKMEKLQENVSLLQNDLDKEKVKLDVLTKQTVKIIFIYLTVGTISIKNIRKNISKIQLNVICRDIV